MSKSKIIFVIVATTFFFLYSAKSQINNKIDYVDSSIFVKVDSYPKFPGGEEKRIKFISKNLKYPIEAQEKNIMGTVYVSFMVEPDGKLSNVKLNKGIGGGCDEEAIRVVKLMPNWLPAKVGSSNVRFQMILPIRFYIKDDETNNK